MKVNSRPKSQVLGGEQADDRDQDRAAEDQPAGEVGELGGQPDAEWLISAWAPVMMIRKIVWVVMVVLDAERRAEGADEEGPGADIDGAEHGDEAEQVEPGRHPAGAAVAEDRAPVIEAARGRIGGADLRHRDGEDETDEAADQPADADADAAGAGGRLRQRVDAAGEDADDREGDGEVREAAQSPFQFLGVAHAMEDLHVLLLVDVGVCNTRRHLLPASHRPTPLE